MADVLFAVKQGVATITLRPKALNALSLEMIRLITPALEEWKNDPAVKCVVLTAEGGKALCAGGDVKAAWKAGQDREDTDQPHEFQRAFFREEYQLNYLIATYPKPYIALMDGIVMGGGLGLSAHARCRIVTETTMCAMPEMAIGLFPDVGATRFLSNMPSSFGVWAGLTGARLNASDALYLGLATHYIPQAKLADFLAALPEADFIDRLCMKYHKMPEPSALEDVAELCERCFELKQVDDIVFTLGRQKSDWAQAALEAIKKGSPTSLKLARLQLDKGRHLGLADALEMEFQLAQYCMAGHDFYEGIRAVLVDKDHAPAWQPASLEDVSIVMIEAAFNFAPDQILGLKQIEAEQAFAQ